MPHRHPGWALPNGHIVRSQSEAALCGLLEQAGFAHDHGALSFDVPTSRTEQRQFSPSIRLTELKIEGRPLLLEPINSLQIGGGLRRLSAFRHGHADEYYVVVVTRRALHHRLPADAYDAVFDLEALEDLGAFLQNVARQ